MKEKGITLPLHHSRVPVCWWARWEDQTRCCGTPPLCSTCWTQSPPPQLTTPPCLLICDTVIRRTLAMLALRTDVRTCAQCCHGACMYSQTHAPAHTSSTRLFANAPHKVWACKQMKGNGQAITSVVQVLAMTNYTRRFITKKGQKPSPLASSRKVPLSTHWPIQQLAGREEEWTG